MSIFINSHARKAFIKGFFLLVIALLLNLWGGIAFAQTAMLVADASNSGTMSTSYDNFTVEHSSDSHKLSVNYKSSEESITTVQITDSKGTVKYLDHISMDSKHALAISTKGWNDDVYEVKLSDGGNQTSELVHVQ